MVRHRLPDKIIDDYVLWSTLLHVALKLKRTWDLSLRNASAYGKLSGEVVLCMQRHVAGDPHSIWEDFVDDAHLVRGDQPAFLR